MEEILNHFTFSLSLSKSFDFRLAKV